MITSSVAAISGRCRERSSRSWTDDLGNVDRYAPVRALKDERAHLGLRGTRSSRARQDRIVNPVAILGPALERGPLLLARSDPNGC